MRVNKVSGSETATVTDCKRKNKERNIKKNGGREKKNRDNKKKSGEENTVKHP
jgi:hypothetical protein